MSTVLPASLIWRKYPVDGVVSATEHQPSKAEIRAWGTWVESMVTAMGYANYQPFETQALMNADLDHDAKTLAVVYDDAGNEGIYIKVGASESGSWSKILDYLPGYQFVRATVTGGTVNAIQATARFGISYSDGAQQIVLIAPGTTTVSPATVSFDGGTALRIRTASGGDIPVGGIVENMPLQGYINTGGTEFWLTNDLATAAYVAAAEAAQVAAEAARDTALSAVPNVFSTTRTAIKALDTSTITAAFLKEAGREGQFIWKTGDYSAQIAADTSEALFIKATAVAATSGAWVRADGWQVNGIRAEWAGAVGDGNGTGGGTNDYTAVNAASKLAEFLGTHVTYDKAKIYRMDSRLHGTPGKLFGHHYARWDFHNVASATGVTPSQALVASGQLTAHCQNTTTTASASTGDDTIAVAATTGMAIGGWLLVYDSATAFDEDTTKNSFAVQITEIAGLDVTLSEPLPVDFGSGVKVYVYDMGNRAELIDCTVIGNPARDHLGITSCWGVNNKYRNLWFYDCNVHALREDICVGTDGHNFYGIRSGSAAFPGRQYLAGTRGCSHCVYGGTLYSILFRHTASDGSDCAMLDADENLRVAARGNTFGDVYAIQARSAPIDQHAGAYETVYGSCRGSMISGSGQDGVTFQGASASVTGDISITNITGIGLLIQNNGNSFGLPNIVSLKGCFFEGPVTGTGRAVSIQNKTGDVISAQKVKVYADWVEGQTARGGFSIDCESGGDTSLDVRGTFESESKAAFGCVDMDSGANGRAVARIAHAVFTGRGANTTNTLININGSLNAATIGAELWIGCGYLQDISAASTRLSRTNDASVHLGTSRYNAAEYSGGVTIASGDGGTFVADETSI